MGSRVVFDLNGSNFVDNAVRFKFVGVNESHKLEDLNSEHLVCK